MKIGFINFFPYRPFVQNAFYLSTQLKELGHEIHYLSCDGSPKVCHNLLIKKKTNKKIECIKCIIGGFPSYTNKYETINKYSGYKLDIDLKDAEVIKWLSSSRATAYRVETSNQLYTEFQEDIDNHIFSVKKIFKAVYTWIEKNSLDALICFNGRMDFTRAAIEAAKSKKIPFLTHDSTWFGNGITISLNAEVISLNQWNDYNQRFRDKPLKKQQLETAISIISRRFLKTSYLEWKQYNINGKKISWSENVKDGQIKVLVLPSSRSEFLGSDDFNSTWSNDSSTGFLEVCNYLKTITNQDISCIVKGHPLWGQVVFGSSGKNATNHYEKWSEENGFIWLRPEDELDTAYLIQQCDIVLVNGSSAALEAVFYKKPIICITETMYTKANFVYSAICLDDLTGLNQFLNDFDPVEQIRKTLRFIYTASRRIPSFINNIVGETITNNNYYSLQDKNELVEMLVTGNKKPFDGTYDIDENNENNYIDSILKNGWKIYQENNPDNNLEEMNQVNIKRRKIFRMIDNYRNKTPKGDEIS